MAQSRLEIIIEAINLAKDELNDLERDLGDVKRRTDDAEGGFSALKGSFTQLSIAAVAVGAGMYKAFEFAEQGAALDMAREKFDRLAISVGTTGDALLNDLQAATKGTRSDFELIAGATDLLSLGLAKSHEQAVRMSRAVGALNMDMNQLTLTLSNQTTMRFDSLGVSVDGFDERLQNLIDTGMDVNDAFTEAFLQQAEAQIERVGDAADTSAGQFAILRATAKSYFDELKLAASDAVAPMVENINTQIAAREKLNDAYESGIINENLYKDAMKQLNGEMQFNADLFAHINKRISDYEKETQAAITSAASFDRSLMNFNNTIEDTNDAVQSTADSFLELDTNAGRAIKNMMEQIAFAQAGGAELIDWIDELNARAMAENDPGDLWLNAELDFAYVKSQDLEVAMGNISAEKAAQNIANTLGVSLETALSMLLNIDATLNGLKSRHTFTLDVIINQSGGVNVGAGSVGTGGGGAGQVSNGAASQNLGFPQIGLASGGEFTVPPGYPNDSFLMGVQSGERVSVQTPRQQQGNRGAPSEIADLLRELERLPRRIAQEMETIIG